jgi:hypothetical protein
MNAVTTTPYGGGIYSFPTNTGLSNPLDLPGFQSTHIPLGAIIGGAAGGVICIIFILVVGWRYRLRRRRPSPPFPNLPPPPQLVATNVNRNDYGKAELAGNSSYAQDRLSKSPAASKATPTLSVVSPVSPMTEKESPMLAGTLELEGQNTGLSGRTEMEAQNRNEVPAGPNAQELHPEHVRYEVQGQPYAHELVNAPRYEVPGSNQHPVEAPATSANMNEGPFFELEGPYR